MKQLKDRLPKDNIIRLNTEESHDTICMQIRMCAYANHQHVLWYSASAFHWVPEEIGYSKVFRILKSGGAFARFANHPYQAKDNPMLFEEIQKAYAEYYYPYYKKQPGKLREYTEEQAAAKAAIADKYGFTDTRYMMFHRIRTLTAAEYRILISTYSDHITIEESIRKRFFDVIEGAINHHGGSVSIFDTIDLQLARKP